MRLLKIILAIAITGVLLTGLGVSIPPLIIALYLLVGWVRFLVNVIPQMQVSYDGIITAGLCLLGIFAVAHFLLSWLYRSLQPQPAMKHMRWQPRWTFTGVAVVIVMFAAGIAASGVIHQSVWLAKSDAPAFTWGRRKEALEVICHSCMRATMQAIQLYTAEHDGWMPNTIDELVASYYLDRPNLYCPASENNGTPLKYVYLGRGMKLSGSTTQPVLAEPLANHGTKLHIGFADGRVNSCSPEQAESIMTAAGH